MASAKLLRVNPPASYRLALEQVPYEIEEFPDSHPVLLLLLQADNGQVLALELRSEAPDLAELADWLLFHLGLSPPLGSSGDCARLLLDDPSLCQSLQVSLASLPFQVELDRDRSLVEKILKELYQGLRTLPQRASSLEALGPDRCREWLEAALAWLKAEPWRQLPTMRSKGGFSPTPGTPLVPLEVGIQGQKRPLILLLLDGQKQQGMVLFSDRERAQKAQAGQGFDFLVGFSLSSAKDLHPDDLQFFQSTRLRPYRRGWPYFYFAETCSEEEKQLFGWLLRAVPLLAQSPQLALEHQDYRLRALLTQEPREDWEALDDFCQPFKEGRQLNKAQNQLLETVHEFLLRQKPLLSPWQMSQQLRGCRTIARFLLPLGPDWKPRLTQQPLPKAEDFRRFSLECKPWSPILKCWKALAAFVKAQDLYYGPSIPLLLMSAEIARLNQSHDYRQRLDDSYASVSTALEGIPPSELRQILQCWKRWLKELNEKYLELDPTLLAQARRQVEEHLQALDREAHSER